MTPRTVRAAALIVALLALGACTNDGAATPPTSWPPASVDALPQMDASAFRALIAQQRGTPVLVNFWAAWCTPCREETPEIVAAHRTWGKKVRFIGVDVQDNRGDAAAFLSSYGVTYPSVFNPSNDITVSYGLFSPPATLFFSADGTLEKTIPGQLSEQDLRANLRAIAG
jgi:cytochrome c biogenesis protein CcmG, thiol:disulfide interchange protein DsbE